MSSEEPQFHKKWAILIGVDNYKFVKPLKYCARDASALAELLRTSLGFEKDDTLIFTENSEYPPERAYIFHWLGEIKKLKNVGPDDLLVFFFSGHGMIGLDDSKDYLLPIEATPNSPEKTGISIEDIASTLKGTGCKNIVMFIDACREPIEGAKGVGESISIGEASVEALKREGIVTFFSCDPKEKSYEIEELECGAFTYCIMEAIKSGKGKTVANLYEYLRVQVPLVNSKYNKPPQLPYAVIEPDEKRNLPIFFNLIKQQEALADANSLVLCITQLFMEGKLEDDYYLKLLEFLSASPEAWTAGVEAKKLLLIKNLCEGRLAPNFFKVAWEAYDEKRRTMPATARAAVQMKIEPLPKKEPPQ